MNPPTLDDLRAVFAAQADDVCAGDELDLVPITPRRAWLAPATAAAAVVAAVATAVAIGLGGGAHPSATLPSPVTSPVSSPVTTSSAPRPVRWVPLSLGVGVRVHIPSTWSTADFHGEPATVAFPLVFLRSRPFTGACLHPVHDAARCTSPGWFAPGWRTPGGGVLISWVELELPYALGRGVLSGLPGRRIRIDGHQVAVWTTGPDQCPPSATRAVIARTDAVGTRDNPTGELVMTACIGPDVSRANLDAVDRMLHSLRIGR